MELAGFFSGIDHYPVMDEKTTTPKVALWVFRGLKLITLSLMWLFLIRSQKRKPCLQSQ